MSYVFTALAAVLLTLLVICLLLIIYWPNR